MGDRVFAIIGDGVIGERVGSAFTGGFVTFSLVGVLVGVDVSGGLSPGRH